MYNITSSRPKIQIGRRYDLGTQLENYYKESGDLGEKRVFFSGFG